MRKTIFLLILLLFSFLAFSAISDLRVEGIVVKYDKKTVTLAQENGEKVKVSRLDVPKYYTLKTGEKIHAIIDNKKLLDQLKLQEESNATNSEKKPVSKDKRGLSETLNL